MNLKEAPIYFFLGVLALGLVYLAYELIPFGKWFGNEAFLGMKTGQVRGMILENAQGITRIEKKGERFFLTRPLEIAADEDVVRAVLQSLNFDTTPLSPPTSEPLNLNEFGFGPPQAKINLWGPLQKITLEIGEKTTGGGERYLRRLDRNGIYKIPVSMAEVLLGPYTNFRDRRIFPKNATEAAFLKMETEEGVRQFEKPFSREPDSAWKILSFLLSARYRYIRPVDGPARLHEYGLKDPDLIVEIGLPSSESSRLFFSTFGGRCFTYLDKSDKIAELEPDSCEELKTFFPNISTGEKP